MPTPLRMASAGATTGKFAPKQIYVIGGLQSGNGLSLNQVYDPQSDNWTLGTSMPTARYGLAVAVVNDTLYAMGGVLLPPYAFPKVPLDANEVYLPLGYEGPMPPYWASPPSPSPSTNRLITISASGSVEGTDQIRRDGDTYVFKSSITGSIVVERENVVVDGAGYTLQGTGSGKGIELADRSNVTIQHVEIEEFDDGIWLFNASNNIITGNTITANIQWGIRLAGSSNNTVSGNNITNNDYGGIVFTDSNNNIISGNNITDSFVGLDFSASENNIVSGNYIENNDDGIHLENMHNSIIGNTITNNGDKGIFLYGAGSNNIIGNNITNNVYGIFVSICWNNPTYHNNFANNAVHIYTDESSGIWDDGKEGNYWDNYTGFDNNGDGIGDTPYLIDENNQDNYPLMNQWIPPTQQPEPFPTTWIIAATAIITIGAVAFLVFFRRIKKTPGEVEKITPEA
jgi:parallel beta-helix repeat protein